MRARVVVVSLVAAGLVVSLATLPGADAQSLQEIQQRLREATAEREALEERLTRAAEELNELEVRRAELEDERDQLEAEQGRIEAQLEELGVVIQLRVREAYKHGSSLDPLAVFLSSNDPTAALSRAQTVQRLVAGDQVRTDEVAAARARLAAVIDRLAEQALELDALEARQQALAAEIEADLARAQELEQQLTRQEREERERLERERLERERRERERLERERRERERQAAQAASTSSSSPRSSSSSSSGGSSGGSSGSSSSGSMVCPLDQPRSFTDTWGAPRSGGRGHRGTDILGPRGIPVRAITSGVWVVQRPGASAGNWGILRADNGDHYWYMHLDSHTVSSGTRVSAGQQVGTNGDTGNARGTPHLHFEEHPGGGAAINPYPLLRRVC